MEAAYGIGVQNRYALFLEEDDVDPYAVLSTSSANVGHVAADLNETKKGSTAAGGGAHSTNKSQQQQGITNKSTLSGPANTSPHSKSTNSQTQKHHSPALSESKQNVVANQKSDSGRPNRSRADKQQRPTNNNRENQENRAQRSRNFEAKDEGGDFKSFKELRGEKVDNRKNGFSRGPRGNDRGRFPKREFNRHSGSDRSSVKSTDKREGGGSHNWGKLDDFIEQPLESEELVNGEKNDAANESEKPLDEGQEEEGLGETADGEPTDAEPKNDEPKFKTLDEYKRELEEKRVHTQFNIRKPGEGEDKSKWKKTYVLKKKPVAEEEEIEYEEIEVEEDTNKRRNRQVLDIEVNFRPAEGGREVVRRNRGPGRGGGGGSGGGNSNRRNESGNRGRGENNSNFNRGSSNRGGSQGGNRGRGNRNRFQPAPKFDDLNDFPSLSS